MVIKMKRLISEKIYVAALENKTFGKGCFKPSEHILYLIFFCCPTMVGGIIRHSLSIFCPGFVINQAGMYVFDKKWTWPFRSWNSEICCISRQWIDKISWFFVWWYKFREANVNLIITGWAWSKMGKICRSYRALKSGASITGD